MVTVQPPNRGKAFILCAVLLNVNQDKDLLQRVEQITLNMGPRVMRSIKID